METHNYVFNQNVFRKFVGKRFDKYKHHKFEYTNSVTLYLGFMIGGISYEMSNDYKAVDYFGWDNEATICSIRRKEWDAILTKNPSDIVETNINEIIKTIILVNDHYSSFHYGSQNYDWWETRAVIFDFGDHQLSFEKQDCWFSMEIIINKGNDLLSKVSDGKFILEDFQQSDQQRITTERQIVILK